MANEVPAAYKTPPFPSLNIKDVHDTTQDRIYTLYYVGDVWRFTVIWTLIMFALFHLGAVLTAWITHGWKKSSWKYLWLAPIVYLGTAAVEAVIAGSIVGLIVGAVYHAGHYEMNTWIPCVWGFVNVVVLIVSSFSISGGL